jgi:hypothetical protein
MTEKYYFDRKTFDPIGNDDHKRILSNLRSRGIGRKMQFESCRSLQEKAGDSPRRDETHRKCCASSALKHLALPQSSEGRVYLDVGCGDSPDRLIARSMGFISYGLDLFAPTHLEQDGGQFIKADAVEHIPLANESVYAITSQAMIDLIETDSRLLFYQQVYRVLIAGGAFSQVGVELVNGYGFHYQDEAERVRLAGFRAVSPIPFGFVAVK